MMKHGFLYDDDFTDCDLLITDIDIDNFYDEIIQSPPAQEWSRNVNSK